MDRARARWDVRLRQIALRQIGSRGAWALIALMGIVVLLGYQQYRWIVRVVDAEETTNREKLASSLKAFADDFDTEITRADLAFRGLTGHSQVDVLEKARERWQTFRELAKYPRLIASVDVTEALPDPFQISGSPPVLVLPAGLIHTSTRPHPGQFIAAQPFAEGRFRTRAESGVQFGGSPVSVRAVLDQAYIVRMLLPALLSQHLRSDAAERYDVLIRTAKTGDVVLKTGGDRAREWDVSRTIFSIRPDCLTDQADRGIVAFGSRGALSVESLLRQSGKCGDNETGAAGIWTISLQGHPSLAESMVSARRQHLAVSFGVLFALVVTVGILFVSAHRARELAALHKQFAAGISHELRTPLSVISSASENLADGVVEDQDQVRQYGRMIHNHSEELAAMIENAIWFARGDGKAGLAMEEIIVEELVMEAAATCAGMLQQAGVVLERDTESGLPTIRGNRTLLLHGLQNLLANVALYGRAGKWARIQARRNGASVEFTIEDRGDGMSPEDLTRVFQPFYRGRGAKQANIAGLGLGLALVRRIAEAHGGRVELRSQYNAGTTVAFRVPIFDPESKAVA
ncbi:MAG TPA: HAMP domain-containing sensor histidine kinase [Bryobacteraceae bacterium]|nr:HAMP domain-containing sensor histidine kinase [Bryobacteraceae bacterium]